MSSEDLINKLDTEEYILPADIRKQTSDEELLKELEQIFAKYKDSRLQTDELFRRKYIDLLNFLVSENLTKKTKLNFNEEMISILLSYPESS